MVLQTSRGKKIRVYSTTLGDFVEGVGGTSVTVSFGEVIPALEKGVVVVLRLGTMSAYTLPNGTKLQRMHSPYVWVGV